jgi:UDP-N-acetylmuramoyl-L-alanyl-D-glutamate--2,6-diaminopimelate ligase
VSILLETLLAKTPVREVRGATNIAVSGIAYDSRKVRPGSLFIALRGEKVDGHDFIDQAVNAGAVAVVVEKAERNPRATTAVVENARAAMADIAAAFYNNPARRLAMTGVTGTNGKTTFTFLLKHICEAALMPSGLLGTVRYEIGGRIIPAARTTPESLDLQEMLSQIRDAGCRAAVMEVSSHALMQERVRGIEFDAAVFTNLTQDHLDYHGTMENYFEAKALLFQHLAEQKHKKGTAVINIDDRYGQRLIDRCAKAVKTVTYGLGARADVRASDMKIDFHGTTYKLQVGQRSYLVRLPLIGRFNVYNSLAAVAAARALGIEVRASIKALADSPGVPGRLEAVPVKRSYRVFVDYAHTPDALINVMKTLRELSPARLVVVFGCGGNRDRAKRPLMGAAVEELADYAIITSDNPRKELPGAIIDEIKTGFRGSRFEVVEDRHEAIQYAIQHAEPRDIVLLAGKGHETYQEFADHTVPFDDVAVAREAMEARPAMEGGF